MLYDLHNDKMLYLLIQHSLFNRKYHPFILCSCARGEGVVNSNHKCKIIPHNDQVIRYERSARQWDLKRNRVGKK